MRRARRGLISDVISAGSKLSVAGWVIKDFEFNLAGPIFKSLKKDQNVHTIKGITHRQVLGLTIKVDKLVHMYS